MSCLHSPLVQSSAKPAVVNFTKRRRGIGLTESTNLLAFFGLSNCEMAMGRRRARRMVQRRRVVQESKDMVVVRWVLVAPAPAPD